MSKWSGSVFHGSDGGRDQYVFEGSPEQREQPERAQSAGGPLLHALVDDEHLQKLEELVEVRRKTLSSTSSIFRSFTKLPHYLDFAAHLGVVKKLVKRQEMMMALEYEMGLDITHLESRLRTQEMDKARVD